MEKKQAFHEAIEKNFQTLKQYVPIVARVHGNHHPEFHDVHRLFDRLNQKVTESGSKLPELNKEFELLRETTNNYTVPADVCESYGAVYTMLAELDKAYRA